jgi:hypothetical protein
MKSDRVVPLCVLTKKFRTVAELVTGDDDEPLGVIVLTQYSPYLNWLKPETRQGAAMLVWYDADDRTVHPVAMILSRPSAAEDVVRFAEGRVRLLEPSQWADSAVDENIPCTDRITVYVKIDLPNVWDQFWHGRTGVVSVAVTVEELEHGEFKVHRVEPDQMIVVHRAYVEWEGAEVEVTHTSDPTCPTHLYASVLWPDQFHSSLEVVVTTLAALQIGGPGPSVISVSAHDLGDEGVSQTCYFCANEALADNVYALYYCETLTGESGVALLDAGGRWVRVVFEKVQTDSDSLLSFVVKVRCPYSPTPEELGLVDPDELVAEALEAVHMPLREEVA